MNFSSDIAYGTQKVIIQNLLPEIGIDETRKEITDGLHSSPRFISSKFFYDKTGTELFREITTLPEYYPTRTEKKILKKNATELINGNSQLELIELGSGDCSKISILFEAANGNHKNICYIPVDVSKSAIENSANELAVKFSGMEIQGFVADFMHQLNLVPRSGKPRMICFFGSTIGNFTKKDARRIIRILAKELLGNDSLLIGFDLVKPESILQAAYNDSKGVTHKFNKNILNVVNTIIDSDFNTGDFDSLSFYNKIERRNEMHLSAKKSCTVHSPFFKESLFIKKGEKIHTENSHKYSFSSIKELTESSGLRIQEVYTDENEWFALVKLGVKKC